MACLSLRTDFWGEWPLGMDSPHGVDAQVTVWGKGAVPQSAVASGSCLSLCYAAPLVHTQPLRRL